MQAVWIKNAIALCLIVESCNGSDFKGPSNTSVPEGTRATLSCQTSPSKTVWWKYFENYVFYANTISLGYKSYYEAYVDASRGIYNLTILNASSHAGLYTCVDDDGEGESGSAWLTVTANETPPTPTAVNKTAAIVVLIVLIVILIIMTVLTIFLIRRQKRYKHKASTHSPNRTVEREEEEAGPLMNPRSQSEDIDILNEITLERTQEPQEDRREDYTVSTVDLEKTHQKEIEETESPTTFLYVASNSQTASSVSSTQEGPVAKPSKPNEQETPLASTIPEEKEESGNDNVNTTEHKSTIESVNMTDNTQTDPLKPDTHKDERPKVLPKPDKPTKICESNVVPEENSPTEELIVLQGMQDSVADKKPKIAPKPNIGRLLINVRTEHTTKIYEICPASNAEQGGHILPIDEKDDSIPKQNEEGIPQQEDIVNTEERDLTEQLMTEAEHKKEISFNIRRTGAVKLTAG